MNLSKFLSPYIDYKNTQSNIGVMRCFLTDKNSYFSISSIYSEYKFYISYLITLKTFNERLDILNSGPHSYIGDAKIILDRYLISMGFTLLTKGQYEKYSVLI